jgi:hypothetical protein
VKPGFAPLQADHREVIGQMGIDRPDHTLVGHTGTLINHAGHLAHRVNACIGPTGKINSHCLATKPGERHLQVFLNASSVLLPL